MDDLLAFAREDKECRGLNEATLNRYPVRFVLFENFADYSEFVSRIDGAFGNRVYHQSIEGWLDKDSPDVMLTSSALSRCITDYVKRLPTNDFVIFPFSELARFYENDRIYQDFDALIRTIRLAEPPYDAQMNHQRIYIPIIGMQGKMGAFAGDPNIHVWEYRTPTPQPGYELVLTCGTTYGIQGLEEQYETADSVVRWVQMWSKATTVTRRIICSSRAIYHSAKYAMPDNAFSYSICSNVYEFLTKGLGIYFGNAEYKAQDNALWEQLASLIDIADFDLKTFVCQRLGLPASCDGTVFVKAWFECSSAFDRWLLMMYYRNSHDDTDYLCRVLQSGVRQGTSELVAALSTKIFDEPLLDKAIAERKELLIEASRHGAMVPEDVVQRVIARVKAIAADSEKGYAVAFRVISAITDPEKELIIEWLGKGHIKLSQIREIYHELYDYLASYPFKAETGWLNEYMYEYRASKTANVVTPRLKDLVEEHNGSPVSFWGWYNGFKTVKSVLASRSDIEVVYWIDGLGVDWIPFICSIVKRHEHEGVYVNDIYVAASKLPSCTSVNKQELQEAAHGELPKIGDLDSFAHTHKAYPGYLVQELKMVEEAVCKVLGAYSGKKIAFVSDHGVSYMPQLAKGLQLAGYETDHGGRCAVCTTSSPVTDDNYVILEDGKTVCALNHDSLSGKVSFGLGVHGGALPEEVLVPIIVVSSQKNSGSFTVSLVSNEISAASPLVRLSIKGLSSIDTPTLIYNDVPYTLNLVGLGIYESERLNLVGTCRTVYVEVGNWRSAGMQLVVNTGVEEEDLFDF